MPNTRFRIDVATILDELELASNSLDIALDTALHSAVHSTYTAAIKRIVGFHSRTTQSTRDLLTCLERQVPKPNP